MNNPAAKRLDDPDVIVLGTASTGTHGSPIKDVDEDVLFRPLALSDD